MSSKKKVIENSFFYIVSSLLVKAMGFMLLPIYTLFLTPDDYGVTNLVTGFINVFTFIVAFSLYSAALRFYTDYKDDRLKLKKLYGTIIVFIFISGIITLLLGIILKNILVSIFFKGIDFYPIVFIALISLIFISLYTMHQSILQGMQQGKKLTKLNLTVFFATAILKVVLIGVFKLGATGFLLAQLIVYMGYLIYFIFDLKKNDLIEWTIDITILKETLRYSIPLMPHNLSTQIANLASRIFINTSGTLTEVGIYSVSMQFGNLIDVIQISVNKAFQPWFYEMLNSKDIKGKKEEVVNLAYILLVFYSLIYMIIGLFSQEVIIFMINDNYIFAWTVVPILIIGFSVKSIYYLYVNIIMFYKQAANKLFIATITGSIIDILLAYILVPHFGMYGSSAAFVIAKIIIIAIVIFLSRKYNNVGFSTIKMLKIILPSLGFMMIGLYFSYTKYLTKLSLFNFIYKITILLIYLLYMYITNKKIISEVLKKGQIIKILKKI